MKREREREKLIPQNCLRKEIERETERERDRERERQRERETERDGEREKERDVHLVSPVPFSSKQSGLYSFEGREKREK